MGEKIHLVVFIALLLFSLHLFCQDNSNHAILRGTIINEKGTIELRSYYDTSDKSKKKVIHLNEDGTFLDSIYLEKEESYIISDKTNAIQIYLSPSKKYFIEYDPRKFKTEGATVKGDDVKINEYYIDKSRNGISFDFDPTGKSEKEIVESLMSIKETKLEKIDEFKLPDHIKKHESASINYEYLRNLSFINEPSAETQKKLNIDYSNERVYKTNAQYKMLVKNYYNILLRQKIKVYQKLHPSYMLCENAIKELGALVPNEYIKNDIIGHAAKFYLTGSKDKEACYNDFKKYYTGNDNNLKTDMLDLYNRLDKLKKGTPSPKFYNFKNYNGGVNSLDDFKGKYVFIDIWATWCSNCIYQKPALKKLEQEYENIVFLSVAWLDDERKWRETIKRESLTGIQLYASEGGNTFFEAYGVRGIPRYILIDQNGNIIDHSTPLPSDSKLKEILEGLEID